ncbi:MAG: hypothetical protein JO259_07695 [Mycobacterium sp.]|nr:hypothetical protein [Mycobacterium sp.]
MVALGGALIVAAGAIVAFNLTPAHTPVRPSATKPPLRATLNSSAPLPTAPTVTTSPVGLGLVADFAHLQTGLHATVGVVVRAAGAGSTGQTMLGGSGFADQPAWSTIKVPLVIAAMRQANIDQPTKPMAAAIIESDNAAAESIWESLGDPTTAAADVGRVLRDAGDPTIVESRKLRPQYTAFGQTDWSLTDQAKFLSVAACDPRDQPVLDLMGQVTNDQRSWGLGPQPGTKIKGGWGPSPSGRYLVRQIAVVPAGKRGLAVVAMAAEPESGSFIDGTRAITEVGNWLQARLDALPAGQCPA